MNATVGICMATFNGARFLPEQLESIQTQSTPDWHLFVRDDGSSDGTVDLLNSFVSQNSERTTIIRDGLGRLGALSNFSAVARQARGTYFAFADQDDIWHVNRLSTCLNRIAALENSCSVEKPAMVHADRRLIDANGFEIAPSYWATRGLHPKSFVRLERHYSFCFAAGSTMLINRALRDLALPVSFEARMYDCWIELVAHAFGSVDAIREPLVSHRRHGRNATGPSRSNDTPEARRFAARAQRLLSTWSIQRNIAKQYFAQAQAFKRRYEHQLDHTALRRLDLFLSLPDHHRMLGRYDRLMRARAGAPGMARALVFAAVASQRGNTRDATESQ